MIVVWRATHSWLVELPYWLESGNLSASSLPSSSTCAFSCFVPSFDWKRMRHSPCLRNRRNKLLFTESASIYSTQTTTEKLETLNSTHISKPCRALSQASLVRHTPFHVIFKTFFLNLASTLCADNTTFSQNYQAQVVQRSAFHRPAV